MLDTYKIDLHDKQLEYIKEITDKYQIYDIGKSIRCLINYSIENNHLEEDIFDKERCVNC